MKRVFAFLLTAVLVLSMFTACSNTSGSGNQAAVESESDTADVKKITVWAWDPQFNISIMNEAAERYEAKHPEVKIEVVEMAKADVEQKLNTTLASNTTEGLPEITLIEDYNAQKYITSYPGAFTDLTNLLNSKDFADYKTRIITIDDKLYGVPFDSGVAGLFYRTDLLEQAGFTAKDLQNITWDQFIEIGKTVKQKTGKYMLGFQRTDGGLMRIMLQSAGTWYFDDSGKAYIVDNEVLKEAMNVYKKIDESGIAKPTSSWDEWVGAINQGEAATITTGVWIVGSIKAAEDQSGKWNVAPVPRLNNSNSKNFSNLGGSSWYILDHSANRDAAIDFMKEIYGADTDFYQTILKNNGAIGTYLPALSGDAFSQADEFFGGEAIYQDLGQWISNIPPVNYGAYTYEADAAVMAQIDAVCNGSMTIDQALENAQAQLENQLQQ
ncbi:MAG: Lactose-binding protein [Oscillospiraceae bacterium]|jgi:lactose/L-arabinose transport system substrate-binding protein